MTDAPQIHARVAVVIPVHDDWEALGQLLHHIDRVPDLDDYRIDVIAVDDASSSEAPAHLSSCRFDRIETLEVVRLVCNLGHQRAIAVGLCRAAQRQNVDRVIVMDGDGEDRPEDLTGLLAAARADENAIICAQRAKRSEGFLFRAGYQAYKRLFQLLTGANIGFGNFCVIPYGFLDALTHNPAVWNHLAAAVARSRLRIRRLSTDRGERYAGRSHMNFVSLAVHGLSAISVYSDVVLVRLIAFLLGIAGLAGVGIAVVAGVRLFSDLAIRGWASGVAGSLAIMLFQSFVFALISVFMLLSARGAKSVLPAIDAWHYVRSCRTLITRGERSDEWSVRPVHRHRA
jgi:polyisoprenyl-phosphate glycosyltransferase